MPERLSADIHPRECPGDRRKRLEEDALTEAMQRSINVRQRSVNIEKKVLHDSARSFTFIQQLFEKLNRIESENLWLVSKKKLDSAAFYIIEIIPSPKITHSVVINDELLLKVHNNQVELKKIGEHVLPLLPTNYNAFHSKLENSLQIISNKSMIEATDETVNLGGVG